MVCSIGSGRMVTMARLLESGSVSRTVTDEASRWTLAAQYIHRELRDADEANLLDEEDMHIFDLKPMTDPLNLVCCNSCKKPVKASRYADHAELCKSLISAKESIPELGGGTGHKKPPRKERKKLPTNATAAVGELERFRTSEGDDIGASDTHPDEQTHMTSSYMEAKRSTLCVDGALLMDGSVLGKGSTEFYAGVKPPPTKRSKLIAAESPLISDDIETASGVTKSLCISTQEAITYGDYNNPRVGIQKTRDNQILENINNCYLEGKGKSDIPAPLATKIFYSQRNHRLRSALTHLYYNSSTNQHVEKLGNVTVVQGNRLPSWTPCPNNLSPQQGERDKHSSPSLLKAEQILAQSSEGIGACPPTLNFSTQYPVNKVLGSRRNPAGMIGSNCISNPYSLSGNSGTMQQTNGSVPVV